MRISTLLCLLVFPLFSAAQDMDAPYLKQPKLPPFSILQEDSVSWFTHRDLRPGAPVIIMLFSPDCDHCQEQTEIFTRNISKLRNVEIVMSTFQPVYKIRKFCKQYDLHRYQNIHIGRDTKYFFGPFYRIRFAPLLAVYDKNHKFVTVFEGDTKVEKLLDALK